MSRGPLTYSLPIWGRGTTPVRIDEATLARLGALGERWQGLAPGHAWPPSQVARTLLVQAGIGQGTAPEEVRCALDRLLSEQGT